MALSKHAHAHLRIGDLIGEGSDLSRDAWREAWAPMLLVIAGHTLMFMNQHVAASDWHAGIWTFLGPALLIFYVPLYGALYRAALGGRAMQSHGPAGLQWNGVEWRLITVGVIIVFLAGLAMTPFLAVTGLAALIMRGPAFTISYLGTWARWAPGAAIIWGFFFWIMAPRLSRLMLGWPYSTAREKTEPFAGWSPAEHSGWSIAWALVGSCIPLALGYLGIYAMTLIEADTLVGNYWPLPEAVGAGLLLGALKAAVTTPLLVGILSGAYWLLEEGRWAQEAAHPKPVHHNFFESLGPAAKAAVAAAVALAAKEAAELGLPLSGVDHHAQPPEPEPEPDAETEPSVVAEEPSPPANDGHRAAEAPVVPEPRVQPASSSAETEMGIEAYEPPTETIHASPQPMDGPVSIWPHSILPPWPKPVVAVNLPKPAPAPLASADEPAHASPETAE